MKFSELKGRAVVRLEEAQRIGEVEDLMVEPVSRHIVSLKVRTGLFSAAELVPAAAVKNVGADAVTIASTAEPAPPSASGAPPLIALSTILGNKVVTDAGTLVGELQDVLLDWANLAITGYEVREGGVFAKTQEFTATPDLRFGEKIITMPAQLLNQPA
ncbi:MAG TPA: PRC-barrel domain-containing protein [Chloroflexia bacterium]|jgi:sporulation protein YlmC with PRC-barrel domain|nr:PRC-barrel domain-containing protein [Chloroflexia bacterium]